MALLLSEIQPPTAICKSLYFPFSTSTPSLVLAKLHSIEIYSIDENGLNHRDTVTVHDSIIDAAECQVGESDRHVLIVLTKQMKIWALAFDEVSETYAIIEQVSFTSPLPVTSKAYLNIDKKNGIMFLHLHVGAIQAIQLTKSVDLLSQKLDISQGRTKQQRRVKNSSIFQNQLTSYFPKLLKILQIEALNGNDKLCYLALLSQAGAGSLLSVEFYSVDLNNLKITFQHSLSNFPTNVGSPNRLINLVNQTTSISEGLILNFPHHQFYVPPLDMKQALTKNPQTGSEDTSLLYETVKLDSSKTSYLQRKLEVDDFYISASTIIDSNVNSDDSISYRILCASSSGTLCFIGITILLPKSLPKKNLSRLPVRPQRPFSDPINILSWDLLNLGKLGLSNSLNQISTNYFMSTSDVSNSMIFKIGQNAPYITIVQYLNEFSNGPILDLKFSDHSATDQSEPNTLFQRLHVFNFPTIYSSTGNLDSSELKLHFKGFNTVLSNTFPEITLEDKKSEAREWTFELSADTILWFQYNKDDLSVYQIVENSSQDNETVYDYNKFDLAKLGITFDEHSFVNPLSDLQDIVFTGSYFCIVTSSMAISFDFSLSSSGLTFIEQRSQNLKPFSKHKYSQDNKIVFLHEDEEIDRTGTSRITVLDLLESSSFTFETRTQIASEIFTFDCTIMNNTLFILISDWLGNANLIEKRLGTENDNAHTIKSFSFDGSAYSSMFLENVGGQPVILATTVNSLFMAIPILSLVAESSTKKSKVYKPRGYLKYQFNRFPVTVRKSAKMISLFYLESDTETYLLDLKFQGSTRQFVYDFGKLNFNDGYYNNGFHEFEYRGNLYLIGMSASDSTNLQVHRLLNCTPSCVNKKVNKRLESSNRTANKGDDKDDEYEITKTLSQTRNKSRKIFKAKVEPRSKIPNLVQSVTGNNINYEHLIFNAVTDCLKVTGLLRKFIIIQKFNMAVLITNEFPRSDENSAESAIETNAANDTETPNLRSRIYLVDLNTLSFCDSVPLEGYEAMDIIHANYKKPDTSESTNYVENILGFEDKTSLGLQKMLENKFVIITSCSRKTFLKNSRDKTKKAYADVDLENEVHEFRLFSANTESKTIHLEMAHKISANAKYCSMANYGYRLFVATGEKTGMFRINFKPSTGKFYIKTPFEKKIAKGFSNGVSCINNLILVNDIYHGPISFKLSRITYSTNGNMGKDIYTVRDYAVANKYEDYEMAVKILIYEPDYLRQTFSAGSLALTSFLQCIVDFDNNFLLQQKKVGFLNQKLHVEKLTDSSFNICDNVNIVERLPIASGKNLNDIVKSEFSQDSVPAKNSTGVFRSNVTGHFVPVALIGSSAGGIYCINIVDNRNLSAALQELQEKIIFAFESLESKEEPVDQGKGFDSYRGHQKLGSATTEAPYNLIDVSLVQKFLNLPHHQQAQHISENDIELLKKTLHLNALGLQLVL